MATKELTELNNSRRIKLILMALLQLAEEGGMRPEDCGLTLEALNNCFDEVFMRDGEEGAELPLRKIKAILNARYMSDGGELLTE